MSEPGRCSPERKVLGELSNMKTEPISPTANLRLLTSLASNLKRPIEKPNFNNNNNLKNDFPLASCSSSLKLLPRKQKSLGLLCNKFLGMYPLDTKHDPPQEISLDGTAKALGTEKRRIYDIINVLESLEMASKAGKNRYIWHGQDGLPTTLTKLKSTAVRLGLREQIHEIQRVNYAYTSEHCNASPTDSDSTILFEETSEEDSHDDAVIKEDKSLGAMCKKFMMLFLISMKNGVINLDIAAKVLITDMSNDTAKLTDNTSKSRFKTKVRRLYDIANVLTAIGLIKKVCIYDRAIRKPVFKYSGPEITQEFLNEDTPIRDSGNIPIGMSTPNKTSSSAPLQGININTLGGMRCKTFAHELSGTPMNDKRKLRKRKLFDTDPSSGRAHSSQNLETKSRSLERLDDSILRVAEMELERLNSSEESKPKACTKLFVRYNSDSCIDASTSNANERISEVDSKSTPTTSELIQMTNIPMIVVSKENLVARNDNNNSSTCLNLPVTPNSQTTILNKIVTPVNKKVYLQKSTSNKIIKLLPIGNLQTLKTIYPKNNTNNGTNVEKIARYKMESNTKPKVINLANFDPKKLIPIKRSDINLSLPVKPIVMNKSSNSTNSGYAILTRIQAPIVSPGDTFKAVQIGNTLQLVPMKNNDGQSINNDDNSGTYR